MTDAQSPGEPSSSPDIDRIAEQLAKNEYFEYRLAGAVRKVALTNVFPALALVASTLGFLGYHSFTDAKEYQNQLKTDLTKQIDDLRKQVDSFNTQLQPKLRDVDKLISDAQKNITNSELTTQAAKSGLDLTTKNVESTVASLQSREDRTREDMRDLENRLNHTADNARDTATQANSSQALAQAVLDNLKTEVSQLKQLEERSVAAAESAQKAEAAFRKQRNTIILLTQTQYIALHSSRTETLELYAPKLSDQPDDGCADYDKDLEKCTVKFVTDKVAPSALLHISTVVGGRETPTGKPIPLAEHIPMRVTGTPFVYEVILLYKPMAAAHHLGIIKVSPYSEAPVRLAE